MKVLFATWPEVEYQAKVLTEVGCDNRLVSYFFSRSMPRPSFRSYAHTGVGLPNPKKAKVDPLKAAKALAASEPAIVEDEDEVVGKRPFTEYDLMDDEIPF